MKLSISNIAWPKEYDEYMYLYLNENKFDGIEIAPTRIFEVSPYMKIEDAKKYSRYIKDTYSLEISSMQSIWFGKSENIFNSEEEKKELISYTKRAIDFAKAIDCSNLVFGCSKNRNINSKELYSDDIVLEFFRELGDYALKNNTILAIEPNPSIYGTNFINTTKEAFDIVKFINNKGIKVNIDLGTIINNKEDLSILIENINLINHIHISEPYLEKIECRQVHKELADILKISDYSGYVSIEMKNLNDLNNVKDTISYIRKIFE